MVIGGEGLVMLRCRSQEKEGTRGSRRLRGYLFIFVSGTMKQIN